MDRLSDEHFGIDKSKICDVGSRSCTAVNDECMAVGKVVMINAAPYRASTEYCSGVSVTRGHLGDAACHPVIAPGSVVGAYSPAVWSIKTTCLNPLYSVLSA